MLAWAESQSGEQAVRVGLIRTRPGRDDWPSERALRLNGSGLHLPQLYLVSGLHGHDRPGLAGSVLVGNDFQFGSLPFYLSKPMGRWHYLGGKCRPSHFFVHLLTTLRAVLLCRAIWPARFLVLFHRQLWLVGRHPCLWIDPVRLPELDDRGAAPGCGRRCRSS